MDGHEDVIQRAWRKNDKLCANDEARAGRIFGLRFADLGFELVDECLTIDGDPVVYREGNP